MEGWSTDHNSVRTRSASGGVSSLAATTPSIMSASTAAHGRPFTRTDTTAEMPAPDGERRRRMDLSTPTRRGGDRKPGASNPIAFTVDPITRTAPARSRAEERAGCSTGREVMA